MDTVTLVRRLHEHRNWVNQKLLAAAADLNDEQLLRTLPIGQGSVWSSLLHLYAAEYVWLGTLLGDSAASCPGDEVGKLPGNQQGEDGIQTLPALVKRWQSLNTRWSDHLNTLTAADLDKTIYRVSTSSNGGQKRATYQSDILLHVCTHAHYTTAQVINMLRQLGITNLPDPMLISMARSQHPENA